MQRLEYNIKYAFLLQGVPIALLFSDVKSSWAHLYSINADE